MSREAFEEKYAQSWADTPPHVRKLWLEAWQAATSAQEARVRELNGLHPTVIEFAKAMQHKLDRNKHKEGKGWERNPDGSRNGWAGCSVEFLTEKLREEVSELLKALEHEGLDEIRNEAADVGNIAMMLADVRGALSATAREVGE